MAISKRTRFEVLRRDSHTCRYCGASAPDVELHVDHVIPVALGGDDKPTNLVTACADCNNGKASTSPSAEVVADVSNDAMRWAQAMVMAGEQINTLNDSQVCYVETFKEIWGCFTQNDRAIPMPPNWQSIILGYHNSHFPLPALDESVRVTMARSGVDIDGRFQYFCGVVRNKLNDQAALAAQLLERGDV